MSNNYENNKKKRRSKEIWRTIGIIVASTLCAAMLMSVGSFVKPLFEKEVNPDNLIKEENYWESATGLKETEKGLKIKWNEDGSIVLSGKHNDDNLAGNALYMVQFTQVILDKGTYVFNSGNDDAKKDEFGIMILKNGETIYAEGSDVKIEITENSTPVLFGIYVKNNEYLWNEKLTPTLVPDGSPVEFYQNKK